MTVLMSGEFWLVVWLWWSCLLLFLQKCLNIRFGPFFCCPTLRSHHTVKFTLISNKTQLASYVSQLYVEKKKFEYIFKIKHFTLL